MRCPLLLKRGDHLIEVVLLVFNKTKRLGPELGVRLKGVSTIMGSSVFIKALKILEKQHENKKQF